jgi:hypothetical protein
VERRRVQREVLKVYNLMCPDAKVELADFDIDMLVQRQFRSTAT